ncbi:MAG: NAD(P)H-binding protein, partial [Thermoleophilaceae bacterium]
RKRTVDLGGAVKLIEAARANGIARYVMVSAMGAAHPERSSDAMRPYIEAKAEADRLLEASGLDYTIVRPGRLTDEPGTGRIAMGAELDPGEVTRDDVAATLAAVLRADATIGKALDLVAGESPIEDAVRAL